MGERGEDMQQRTTGPGRCGKDWACGSLPAEPQGCTRLIQYLVSVYSKETNTDYYYYERSGNEDELYGHLLP